MEVVFESIGVDINDARCITSIAIERQSMTTAAIGVILAK